MYAETLLSLEYRQDLCIDRAVFAIGVSAVVNLQQQGYLDPAKKEVRRIPFEIMVQGDKEPVYEENLEDNGRFNEQPVLPFNAFGSLALARSEFETNSGSSQVFWLLKVACNFWLYIDSLHLLTLPLAEVSKRVHISCSRLP